MTKEEVISKYKKLKIKLGKKPNLREFRKQSGVSDRILAGIYGRNAFTKLVSECGDKPSEFGMAKSELVDVLSKWGKLTRKIGMIPTMYEWDQSGNKPTVSGIKRSHNLKWTEIPAKFHETFKSELEWVDIIELLNFDEDQQSEIDLKQSECYVYLMKDNRNKYYKIGISNEPSFREKTLQSEQPKIELIAKKIYVNRKMAGAIEKALHNVYQHKHIRGEWFRLDEEDLNELKQTLNE